MPNSPIDDDKLDGLDKKLSRLLSRSEPPRSPQHLDESILSHARAQAEVNRQAVKTAREGEIGRSEKQSSDYAPWFRQNWIPATVTFSIAAVAITVTLQNFGPMNIDRDVAQLASQSESPFSEASSAAQAEPDDAPIAADTTLERRARPTTQSLPANVEIQQEDIAASGVPAIATTLVETDRITELAEELEDLAQQLDQLTAPPEIPEAPANTTSLVNSVNAGNGITNSNNVNADGASNLALSNNSDVEQPATNGVSQQAEQVIVTGSFVRGGGSNARAAAVQATPAAAPSISNSDLAEVLKANSNDQAVLLALLEAIIDPQSASNSSAAPSSSNRSGLGLFDSLGLVATTPNNLEDRRGRIINQYGNLSDPEEFLNLASQYRQLRQTLPTATPETLEAAIELLELLNQ